MQQGRETGVRYSEAASLGGRSRMIGQAGCLALALVLAPTLADAGQSGTPHRPGAMQSGGASRVQLAQVIDPALQPQLDALFDRMLREPANLDLILEYAALATQAGDLEGAVTAYERLLIFNPNLPRIRFELAALYTRLQSPEIARSYLERALADPELPADVRPRAVALKAQLDAALRRDVFTASVTLGYRYQTNANAGSSTSSLRAFGVDINLPNNAKPQADGNGMIIGQIRNQTDLGVERGDTWDTDAFLYATRQLTQHNLDLVVVEARTGPKIPIFGADDPLTIRPNVVIGGILLEDRIYQESGGFGVDVVRPITQDILFDGNFTRRFRYFRNDLKRPTNSDQSGYENNAQLHVRWNLNDTNQIALEGGVRNQDARRSFQTFTELSIGANYTLRFDAPYAVTTAPWTVNAGLLHLWTGYRAGDPSIDPDTKRNDRELRLTATGAVPLTTDYSMFLQVQHSRIDSNITNYTSVNTSTLLGVTRAF